MMNFRNENSRWLDIKNVKAPLTKIQKLSVKTTQFMNKHLETVYSSDWKGKPRKWDLDKYI